MAKSLVKPQDGITSTLGNGKAQTDGKIGSVSDSYFEGFLRSRRNCRRGTGRSAARLLALEFANKTGNPPMPWRNARAIMLKTATKTEGATNAPKRPQKFFKRSLIPNPAY